MTTDYQRIFGNIVRSHRALNELNQDELAEIVGVDTTTISEIENGRRSPTLNTVIKIAHAFKVTPSELLMEIK